MVSCAGTMKTIEAFGRELKRINGPAAEKEYAFSTYSTVDNITGAQKGGLQQNRIYHQVRTVQYISSRVDYLF